MVLMFAMKRTVPDHTIDAIYNIPPLKRLLFGHDELKY